MNTQDIRKEQEQVLAHAAERPSELFGLLDYIFDHANGAVDEAEARILDEIKRWVRDMGKAIAGKKVQLKKLKEQLLSAPTLTPAEAYYTMNSGGSGEGERVQSSHISDPTAKAAIGALDYIIRTWRDAFTLEDAEDMVEDQIRMDKEAGREPLAYDPQFFYDTIVELMEQDEE